MEQHANFSKFLSGDATATATASKSATGKKRKAAEAPEAADTEPAADNTDSNTAEGKVKKAPAKGKRGKKVKTEETEDERVKDEDNSADGGDGLGEFVYKENVIKWLHSTDGLAEEV